MVYYVAVLTVILSVGQHDKVPIRVLSHKMPHVTLNVAKTQTNKLDQPFFLYIFWQWANAQICQYNISE